MTEGVRIMQQYRSQIEEWYLDYCGDVLNLDHPKTFNEKMQWLKLFDSTPIKTQLADKYLVREWIKEKIGEEYLIPLIGVYENFSEIDFHSLPSRYVIKCNHGCEFNIVVKDSARLDVEQIGEKVNQWLNVNFGMVRSLPLHYKNIKPKIIIEQYIENRQSGGDLYDYKFWCFGGKVKYIMYLSGRNLCGLRMNFFNRDWENQGFAYNYPMGETPVPRPDNLEEMIELAEKLAAGFSHVRVDFYRLDDGRVYFGEMTFTSASGCCRWSNDRINQELGELIELPQRAYNVETGEWFDPEETRTDLAVVRKAFDLKTGKLQQKIAKQDQWLAESLEKREVLSRKNSELRAALEKTRADRDEKSRQLQEFRTACRLAKETVVQVRTQRDELARKIKALTAVLS